MSSGDLRTRLFEISLQAEQSDERVGRASPPPRPSGLDGGDEEELLPFDVRRGAGGWRMWLGSSSMRGAIVMLDGVALPGPTGGDWTALSGGDWYLNATSGGWSVGSSASGDASVHLCTISGAAATTYHHGVVFLRSSPGSRTVVTLGGSGATASTDSWSARNASGPTATRPGLSLLTRLYWDETAFDLLAFARPAEFGNSLRIDSIGAESSATIVSAVTEEP